MGFLAKLLKWKSRFVIVSSFVTVILIPFLRWLLKDRKSGNAAADKKNVVDAEFEEVRENSEKTEG